MLRRGATLLTPILHHVQSSTYLELREYYELINKKSDIILTTLLSVKSIESLIGART